MGSPLVRAKEMSKRTGIKEDALWRLARLNLIPHVRAGRMILFSVEAVDDWISRGGTRKNDEGARV